jgi:hypothetical protein
MDFVEEVVEEVTGVVVEVIGEAAVDRVVSLMQHNQRGIPPRPQTILIEGLWANEELLRSAGRRSAAS